MRIGLVLFHWFFVTSLVLRVHAESEPTVLPKGIDHYVFIHGTFFPAISMFTNPLDVYTQDIKSDCCYRRTLEILRKDTCFYESQIIFDLGMHRIDLTKSDCAHLASYQIANAFEVLIGDDRPRRYYTFGWSGELSVEGRKQAAADLYRELTTIITSPNDRLILIGHSHGGNVIAYLAQEEALHKKGLAIHEAYLLAVPIQIETAHLFAEPFFHNVYSFYSARDVVQVGDTISAPSRKSYRKLTKFIKTNPKKEGHLLDIELVAHHKTLFGHRVFFYFNQLRVPSFESFYARHHYTIDQLAPLPLVAVIPMLQTVWHKIPAETQKLTVNLHSLKKEEWCLHIIGEHECYTTCSYTEKLQQIKERLEREWLPKANTNEVMKNIRAAGTAIKHRCGFVCNGKKPIKNKER